LSTPPDRIPTDLPVHDPLLPEERDVHGELLRAVMRRVASPVTIVTVAAGGSRRGATIGSFTSVSLHPPLVTFNVMKGTGFYGVLRAADGFAVHLLRDDQADLAEHFATPDLSEEDLFRGVDLRDGGADDPPLLPGVLGVLHCRVWEVHEVGDHLLVIGEVERVDMAPLNPNAGPLIYHARAYRAVGPEV
jgi:3-hydroxy-9,10-secoandrosta-1,3,5(10)-triene-9,17-dione monooxygenase reductase component